MDSYVVQYVNIQNTICIIAKILGSVMKVIWSETQKMNASDSLGSGIIRAFLLKK